MATENKTKIHSVHYNYIGTYEQFNAFIKSVVKDYITEFLKLKQLICLMDILLN